MVALLASIRPVFSSISTFFLLIHRMQPSFQHLRSTIMHQANTLHRSRQFMKIMFVLIFTLHLFAYFGALIFPLSRTVGVISKFSLPAAATSVNSLHDGFYRPKYLQVAPAEHSQLFWNHFNFITPMIDSEVLFFVAPAIATHSFHSGDTFFPHWYFLFFRSSLCSTILFSSVGRDSHLLFYSRVPFCPHWLHAEAPHFFHAPWKDFSNGHVLLLTGTDSAFHVLRYPQHSAHGATLLVCHDTFLHVQPRGFENTSDVLAPPRTHHALFALGPCMVTSSLEPSASYSMFNTSCTYFRCSSLTLYDCSFDPCSISGSVEILISQLHCIITRNQFQSERLSSF